MMTLKQVEAERAEVLKERAEGLKRWEATFGTPAGDACKARIAELLERPRCELMGFTVPLDTAEEPVLRTMNRRQSRAWLRKNGGFKRR